MSGTMVWAGLILLRPESGQLNCDDAIPTANTQQQDSATHLGTAAALAFFLLFLVLTCVLPPPTHNNRIQATHLHAGAHSPCRNPFAPQDDAGNNYTKYSAQRPGDKR